MQMAWELLVAFAAMWWEIFWGLAFGFLLSAGVRTFVSTAAISASLGRTSAGGLLRATVFGAISSSCSYAAASMSRTLLLKGSSLANAMAFLIASTNLVFEIFVVLVSLLGWAFFWGELIGGTVLILITALLVQRCFPAAAAAELAAATTPADAAGAAPDDSSDMDTGSGANARPPRFQQLAGHFAMDVSMVGKDILIGVAIASVLMVFVPRSFWSTLFLSESSQLPLAVIWLCNAIMGVIVAVLSFVCSVGNIVLAGVLWYGGISFGGVIAFILADLVTLPMLSVYRRYYGTRPAAWMALLLTIGIIATGLIVDGVFHVFDMLPPQPTGRLASHETFAWDSRALLNLIALPLVLVVFVAGRRQPMRM